MRIFNDSRRYLIVLAVLILVGFCLYFNFAFNAHEDTLVREMAHEKRQDVGLISGIVDKLAEMDKEAGIHPGYEELLLFAVRYIEANFHLTFAQLFDDRLTPVTPLNPGVGGGQKHNPLDYPQFVEAVLNNESGDLVYSYATEQAGNRDVYMTFRWVPADTGHSVRYLVAVGVSRYTISEQIDMLAIFGALALIAVAAVFIISSAVIIIKHGHTYDSREGDTRRDGR